MTRLICGVTVVLLVAAPLAAAEPDSCCTDLREQISRLSQRLAALEAQVKAAQKAAVAEIQTRPAAPAKPATPAKPTRPAAAPATPSGIDPIYGQIDDLLSKGKIEEAQKLFADRKATGERSATINTLTREMGVVGKATPEWAIEMWFQGRDEVNLDGERPVLLIFWEAWCPHCRTEIPRLQAIDDRYRSRGLRVVGLTRLTRTATAEAVRELIAEQGVRYPIAKETGALAEYFHVKGIPAAAVVKGRKILWRGHPLRLTDAMIERWL